jgi:hypothetical protein
LLAGALAIALLLLTGSASESRADYVPPAAPPPEYQALYDELSLELTDFQAQLDAQWDGSIGSGRMAGALAAANGNKSIGLLGPGPWAGITAMLDRFQAMGVKLVKIEVQYPVLTPAFHSYLAANPPPPLTSYAYTADYFIGYPASFYNRLAAEVRSRGLGLWVEYGTLFGDYTPTPASGYFADMRTAGQAATQERYRAERAAEAALIATHVAPDYLTLVEEPETQARNFGYFPGGTPIFDTDEWAAFAQYLAQHIESSVPGSTARLGAGSGTWDGRGYTERFAALPELDYIDIHMYPLGSLFADYLQAALDWADYVRSVAPEKKLMIGEAWLYKASASEVSGNLDYNTVFGRDVYSFWEPLDRQMLDVLFKVVHLKDFEAFMPFWSQYYFGYLTYGDPETEGLSGPELIALAAQRAGPNVISGTLTGTGEKFVELVALEAQADGDNDGYTDIAEGGMPLCGDGRNEDDSDDSVVDDGCPGGPPAAGVFSEAEFNIGTSATDGCGAGPEAGPSPSWPPDFVSGGIFESTDRVNIADLNSFLAPRRLDTNPGEANFDPRWDLSPGRGIFVDWISIQDLNALLGGSTGFPPMFGGARAMSGPACIRL